MVRNKFMLGSLILAAGVGTAQATVIVIYDSNGFETPTYSTGGIASQDSWVATGTGGGGTVLDAFSVFGSQAAAGAGSNGAYRPLSTFSFNQATDTTTDLRVQFAVGTTQRQGTTSQTNDVGISMFGLTTSTTGNTWNVLRLRRQSFTNATSDSVEALQYNSSNGATANSATVNDASAITAWSSIPTDPINFPDYNTISSEFIEFDATIRYVTGFNNDRVKVLWRKGTSERVIDSTDGSLVGTPTYTYGSWNAFTLSGTPDAEGFYQYLDTGDVAADAPGAGLLFATRWNQNPNTGNSNAQRLDNVLITSTVIPEPASAALLAVGGLCLLARRRR